MILIKSKKEPRRLKKNNQLPHQIHMDFGPITSWFLFERDFTYPRKCVLVEIGRI